MQPTVTYLLLPASLASIVADRRRTWVVVHPFPVASTSTTFAFAAVTPCSPSATRPVLRPFSNFSIINLYRTETYNLN